MTRELISYTNANICCLPQRPQVWVNRRISQAMKMASSAVGSVCGNEIEIARYTKAWISYTKSSRRKVYGTNVESPVSIPDTYTVVAHYVVKTHPGLKHISPARYLNVVSCKTKFGHKVAFIGTHAVSKPRKGVSQSAWRMRMWNQHWSTLMNLMGKLHRQGYTVFVSGDFNKSKLPLPKTCHLLAHSGYDYVFVFYAAGVHAEPQKQKVAKRTALMDHPLVTGSVWLS